MEALEEGVSYAPSVWRLWQLLGNYYSDQGRYEDALNAYRSALACPQTYPASIHLNIAILLTRQEEYTEALEILEGIAEEDLRLPVMAVRTESLNALERYEETLALASDFLDAEAETEQERHFLARILTALALAHWKGRGDRVAAIRCLQAALGLDKNCRKALWLLRQIDGEISPNAKYYRVLVEGVWPEPFEGETVAPGFFTSYDVVADSREEALAYIRRIEPDDVRKSLRVDEAKALEKRPDDPKGVYAAGPFSLFPREKSKKKPSKTRGSQI